MRPTFAEIQLIVSTVMLLPALIALIVLAATRSFGLGRHEMWSPADNPERDWWSDAR